MAAERAYVPAMSPPAVLMTADDLLRTHVPDKRTELVRGVLVVREPAGSRHGLVTMNLGAELAVHVKRTGAGGVYAAETGFKVATDPDTVRAPDIAFVTRERLPPPSTMGYPALAPDLAVEVLSPGDRPGQVLAKVADWLSAGTRLVWVLDPDRRRQRDARDGRRLARRRGRAPRICLPARIHPVDRLFRSPLVASGRRLAAPTSRLVATHTESAVRSYRRRR